MDLRKREITPREESKLEIKLIKLKYNEILYIILCEKHSIFTRKSEKSRTIRRLIKKVLRNTV